MRKAAIIILALLMVTGLLWTVLPEPVRRTISSALGLEAFIDNESGLRAVKAQDMTLATERWGQAASSHPNNPLLQFNLGLGYQWLQRGEDAFKAYKIAEETGAGGEIPFYTHFNKGVLETSAKKTDEALNEYQAALDVMSDSVETKTNIELLIQQNAEGKGQGQDKKDGKEGESDEDKDKEKGQKPDEPKKYAENQKPQPKQFKSEELTPADVNKILGEIRQQEQKIRSEYNKRETKEQPRDKDW